MPVSGAARATARLVSLALMSWPALLRAQEQAKALVPSGAGFSIAGGLSVARLSSSGSGLDGNTLRPGGRVEVAYGVSPRLALLGALHAASATASGQAYTANGLEMGFRYLAQAGRRVRPFAEGGLAVRTMSYEASATFTSRNVGPWAGLGVMRLAASHWAGDAALTWGQSRFDSWKVDGTAAVIEAADWSSVGARVGVRYWVHAR